MFENHCDRCNCDFDVLTQLRERDKMGLPEGIRFCPHCGDRSTQEVKHVN